MRSQTLQCACSLFLHAPRYEMLRKVPSHVRVLPVLSLIHHCDSLCAPFQADVVVLIHLNASFFGGKLSEWRRGWADPYRRGAPPALQ